MGSMLIFIFGILGVVGLSLHQFSEQYRFDMVSDTKNGGVFIIDRKAAAINYCDDKKCLLVGSGVLPSQIMNNPTMLASLQNAIMGAPAPVVAPQPGQAPKGMEKNLASSGEPKKEHVDEEKPQKEDSNSDESKHEEEHEDDHADNKAENKSDEKTSDEKTPEGFDF